MGVKVMSKRRLYGAAAKEAVCGNCGREAGRDVTLHELKVLIPAYDTLGGNHVPEHVVTQIRCRWCRAADASFRYRQRRKAHA